MPKADRGGREFFPQMVLNRSRHMNQERPLEIYAFLEETERTNEDTEYDVSKDPLVNALISLVNASRETAIIEDFEKPFVHPMVTIQKWVTELKQLIRAELAQIRNG
jgi:hypothetical protein